MKKTPIKKIRRIEGDDPEEDIIRVFIEVPSFENFGRHLGEMERKAWDAQFDDPPDEGQFDYNLERLTVSCPEGMNWDKTLDARVDQFLVDWPKIRPRVLKEVFNLYKKIQPEVRRIHDNPGAPFVLPEPATPEVVADLFRVSGIYLQHDETSIGIGGGCTWDLEHLWGVLLRDNNVVEVGGIDAVC